MVEMTKHLWLRKMTDAFCNPPKLDDNIEEGLVAGQKGNFGKSKVSLSPFQAC